MHSDRITADCIRRPWVTVGGPGDVGESSKSLSSAGISSKPTSSGEKATPCNIKSSVKPGSRFMRIYQFHRKAMLAASWRQ